MKKDKNKKKEADNQEFIEEFNENEIPTLNLADEQKKKSKRTKVEA